MSAEEAGIGLQSDRQILAINAGSSSIRFVLFRLDHGVPQRQLQGKVERIGLSGTRLSYHDADRHQQDSLVIGDADQTAATMFLVDWLQDRMDLASVWAIGHRIVTGGTCYFEAQRVTSDVLDDLRRISAYAPEHLPAEIALIERFHERVSPVPQVACFDTGFHRDMPQVAKLL